MTTEQTLAEINRKLYLAAFAILVHAGLIDREDAIDRVVTHRARQPLSPVLAACYPEKYDVARVLAFQTWAGEIDYGEAEITLAIAIDRGRFSDDFDQAQTQAGELLNLACRRLDKLTLSVASELQDAISGEAESRVKPVGVEHEHAA